MCQRNKRCLLVSPGKANRQKSQTEILLASCYHYFTVFFQMLFKHSCIWCCLSDLRVLRQEHRVHRNKKLQFSASLAAYSLNMYWMLCCNHQLVQLMEVLLWILQHLWGIQETETALEAQTVCISLPLTLTDEECIQRQGWAPTKCSQLVVDAIQYPAEAAKAKHSLTTLQLGKAPG